MNSIRDIYNREIYRRSISGIVAHILFLILIYSIIERFYKDAIYNPILLILILLGIVLRSVCLFCFKKNEFLRKSIFLLATIILGFSWGEMALRIISTFGVESIQTMIAMGLISTMIAISVASLSPYPPALIAFLIPSTIYPSFVLLTQKQPLWDYLGLFFLANCIYQLISGYRIYRSIIKQLKELSKQMREKQRLQEIIDSIPTLVLIINKKNTYEMVNNFQEGFFQKMLLGNDLGVLPNSPVENALREFQNSEEHTKSLEIRSYVFGPEDWYMVTMNKLNFDRGIICNIFPITEIVKTRNELQVQRARNEYSSKLINLGEVAANITHELGNPLAIIKGSIEVLQSELEGYELSEIARKKLKDIDSTTNRMGGIIKGLESISQNRGLELKNVKFRDVIEPIREITADTMNENNISLIVNGEDSEVDLFCDDVQISQVLLNLVDNAIDAIKFNEIKWISITYKPGFEWCEIIVQDSGKIESKEVRDKIMLPFFTTKNKEKGTGLGLSISEKIIHEHKGRLRLQDKAEGGTTFLITLPRMP